LRIRRVVITIKQSDNKRISAGVMQYFADIHLKSGDTGAVRVSQTSRK